MELYLRQNVYLTILEEIQFLKDVGNDDKCKAAIKNLEENNKFNIKKLLAKSEINIKNYDENKDFYQNLYNFVIAMANVLTNNTTKFETVSTSTQTKVLTSLGNFITQTIEYQRKFMTTHKVIDDSLIMSGYNMLLLLYTITSRHASVDKSYKDLEVLYNELITQIEANIKIYEEIDINEITKVEPGTKIDPNLLAEIEKETKRLRERLIILGEQHKQLRTNVDEIKKRSANLAKVVTSEEIQKLATNLGLEKAAAEQRK